MSARHLIVSTHFDDAVLSVARLLQAAGPLATVITVCGGAPAEGTPAGSWDARSGFATGDAAARARALEDAAACAITGARAHRLAHCDSPYSDGPIDRDELRGQIAELLPEDALLWLPAGIVNPDHVNVRDALIPLARSRPERTGIYADLPYAATDRFDLPPELAAPLPGLACEDVEVDGARFARKIEAVTCHGSQIPLLVEEWRDLLAPRGPLRRERYWSGQVALAASATWRDRDSGARDSGV
jgi:LmbE family N-acetylglucosaminyl deacetylase